LSNLVNAQNNLPAIWLREKISGFASAVISIVPSGYEAYCRLLHPAYFDESGNLLSVGWQRLFSDAGICIDKTSQWESIISTLGEHASLHCNPPLEGSLEEDYYKAMIEVLKSHTNTPEKIWFGIWVGYESVCEVYKLTPTFSLLGRDYYLLSGNLTQSQRSLCRGPFYQSANIFWPDDRAWCVGSDVDLKSSYISASESAVHELMIQFAGEAFRVDPHDSITLNMKSLS